VGRRYHVTAGSRDTGNLLSSPGHNRIDAWWDVPLCMQAWEQAVLMELPGDALALCIHVATFQSFDSEPASE
jgi:hypothetical protein